MRSSEKLDKRDMDALDETRGQLVTLDDGTPVRLKAGNTCAATAGHEGGAVPDEAVVLNEARTAPHTLLKQPR